MVIIGSIDLLQKPEVGFGAALQLTLSRVEAPKAFLQHGVVEFVTTPAKSQRPFQQFF
jgi:hypothetical protein